MTTRGISGWGTYLPHRRLDRRTIAEIAGSGGGSGTRTVASYDEDTTTMGVEAARRALAMVDDAAPRALWFSTAEPAYLDTSNAATVHAALRLARDVGAYDSTGSVRSALGALRAALAGEGPALAVASGMRGGLPGGPDEATGGDGAAALLVGDEPVAVLESWTSVSEPVLDRWRTPGESRSKLWEERYAEMAYLELGVEAWEQAGLDPAEVDHLVVTGNSPRAATGLVRKLGVDPARVVDDLSGTVGNTAAAHPILLLASALERARPGQSIAVVVLSDGAEVIVLRTTDALAERRAGIPVTDQVAAGGPVSYGTYLAWRGMLPVEPPRRPEPARPSASAARRSAEWKYGFVGSVDDQGEIHLPPAPSESDRRPMADATGTIVTSTIDRLAYSPSPPVVFAVVDFDGGGRLPVELTDVDADEVSIGARVEMTFRRLFTSDGIHNYFWKARLIR